LPRRFAPSHSSSEKPGVIDTTKGDTFCVKWNRAARNIS
jgi:hypothetical protein